jgi:hypothetical protein
MYTENEKVKKSREHRPVSEKRSKNGPKKNECFILENSIPCMLSFFRKHEKSSDARFFRSIYSFFSLFENGKNPKKSKKCPKNRTFPYALRHFFQYIHKI